MKVKHKGRARITAYSMKYSSQCVNLRLMLRSMWKAKHSEVYCNSSPGTGNVDTGSWGLIASLLSPANKCQASNRLHLRKQSGQHPRSQQLRLSSRFHTCAHTYRSAHMNTCTHIDTQEKC